MPFGIGVMELVLVLAVVLLFSAKRLPELASGLGLGLRGFQRALQEGDPPVDGAAPRAHKPGE